VLKAIINMPRSMPEIERWYPPHSQDKGSSSSKLIKTMIPATKARQKYIIVDDRTGISINKARTAPSGSAKPDRKEYKNAFFLLLVA